MEFEDLKYNTLQFYLCLVSLLSPKTVYSLHSYKCPNFKTIGLRPVFLCNNNGSTQEGFIVGGGGNGDGGGGGDLNTCVSASLQI